MPDDDSEWLEPSDTGGLWEHQGRYLTLEWLMFALRSVGTGQSIDVLRQVRATLAETADIPVEVEYYDGATTRTLHPMHIDVRAIDGRPSAVVITVA